MKKFLYSVLVFIMIGLPTISCAMLERQGESLDPSLYSEPMTYAYPRYYTAQEAKYMIGPEDVNIKSKSGYTLLHMACLREDIDGYHIAKFLLDSGCAIDDFLSMESKYPKYTPLHLAARFGSPEVVNLLLCRNADQNAKTHNGETAIDLARNGTIKAIFLSARSKDLFFKRIKQVLTKDIDIDADKDWRFAILKEDLEKAIVICNL